ncbi:MAG: SDR family oxidoreductase [Dehalococcoidia bacterium]|nr:SDR family oxidoreductase [Dehalococcoidia bacterium]
MGQSLKDRVAVVTGGGGGIGREICLLMAKEGAKVVVNDFGTATDGSGQNNAPASVVVDEIKKAGGSAVANFDSVATWDSAANIIKTAIDNFGKIDIVVNNAGVARDRMMFNMSEQEWDIVVKTHLYGSFFVTRHAIPLMKQQGYGRVIFMSSNAAYGVSVGQANYGAAKAGMLCLSGVVANSMGKVGVTSNCIFPHADTRLTLTEAAKKQRAALAATGVAPSGDRDPSVVAPMVAYLCSEAAANITNQIFDVAGSEISRFTWPLEPVKSIFSRGKPWTVEELAKDVPATIAKGLVNPFWPPKQEEKKP